MSTPLVSIIINCHNGEKYLNECLDSIILQSYKNWKLYFGTINLKIKVNRYLIRILDIIQNIFILRIFKLV